MLLFSYVDKISTCADSWFWFNLYIINEHDFKDYYKRTRFQTLSTLHVQVVWTDRRYIQVGMQPLFEQNGIPFIQGCFVPSLVEIDPVVLEKKFF